MRPLQPFGHLDAVLHAAVTADVQAGQVTPVEAWILVTQVSNWES